MKRSQRGFTLVEMVVTMAISSIILLAGYSLISVTLRIQNSGYTETSRQDTARVAMTLVETLADKGELAEYEAQPDGDVELTIKDSAASASTVLYYDDDENKLYVGNDAADGTLLMNDVSLATTVDGQLFTVRLTDKTSEETYSATMLCRQWEKPESAKEIAKKILEELTNDASFSDGHKETRLDILTDAFSQLGSTGKIISNDLTYNGEYYSKWYEQSFPYDTAWCACFVSWCIYENRDQIDGYNESGMKFASVSTKWKQILENAPTSGYKEVTGVPTPGDLVFFDHDKSNNIGGFSEPDHVGFVLKVDGNTLYTIEGNYNNKVALVEHSYGSADIVGYAALDWADSSTSPGGET